MKKILIFLLAVVSFFFFSFQNAIASFSYTKVNNSLQNFYNVLDNYPRVETRIERLNNIISRIDRLRHLHKTNLSNDSKQLLNIIEQSVTEKLHYYKSLNNQKKLSLEDILGETSDSDVNLWVIWSTSYYQTFSNTSFQAFTLWKFTIVESKSKYNTVTLDIESIGDIAEYNLSDFSLHTNDRRIEIYPVRTFQEWTHLTLVFEWVPTWEDFELGMLASLANKNRILFKAKILEINDIKQDMVIGRVKLNY